MVMLGLRFCSGSEFVIRMFIDTFDSDSNCSIYSYRSFQSLRGGARNMDSMTSILHLRAINIPENRK